ncbi:cupin domain-containing protein [Agrobacterium sp.]|jgi:quercetin dioxygenase-like cupin family protein|uniref:cupin domain-containing protein n=1 Tax=Agrobacterium sp. TaxID=361 RepID=UPI0028AE3257
MFKVIAAAGGIIGILATPVFAAQKALNAKVSVVFDQKLPNVPGKSLRGVLVEYGPGGYNPSHTHARSAFIYATVIEGEVKSKINGGEEKVFKTGENWIEMPGDHHQVSANASSTKPAKILAVFVVDTTETVLTTPDP